jgi:hypothetical protein
MISNSKIRIQNNLVKWLNKKTIMIFALCSISAILCCNNKNPVDVNFEMVNFAPLVPGNTWIYSIDSSYYAGMAYQQFNWNSHGTLTIAILDTLCKVNKIIVNSKINEINSHYSFVYDKATGNYLPDTICRDTSYTCHDTLVISGQNDTLSKLYCFWNPMSMPSDRCIKTIFCGDSLYLYSRNGMIAWNDGSDIYSFQLSYSQSYGLIYSNHSRGSGLHFNEAQSTIDSTRLISFNGKSLSD